MPHHVPISRILKRDWPAFGLSLLVILSWLIALGGYAALAAWYPQDKEGWVIARIIGGSVLLVMAVCGAVIGWRVHIIRRVFGGGEVVHGKVLRVGENSEDIGNAVIVYRYQGREYQVTNVTEAAAGRGGFKPGDEVDIVVDPGKPSRAFIAKLYLDEKSGVGDGRNIRP